jgi:hypothetical protein
VRSEQKSSALNQEESTALRSAVGALNWAVHGTRPDLAFDVLDLSTRLNIGTVADLIRVIKIVKKAKSYESFIEFPSLGSAEKWRI